MDFQYYRPLSSNESATTVSSNWLLGKWSSCFGKCSQGNIANAEESLLQMKYLSDGHSFKSVGSAWNYFFSP